MPITFESAVRESTSTKVTVTSPGEEDVVISGNGVFLFDADIQNFTIGATELPSPGAPPCAIDPLGGRGGGQHILLIVDNDQAYKIYQLPQSIPITAPTDGTHTLRAYLSRSWEESIKGSIEDLHFSTRTFFLNSRSNTAGINRAVPLLACSSPLQYEDYGSYQYDRVLLDFFVMFEEVSNECAVHVELRNGSEEPIAEATLTTWQSYCIRGLPQPAPGATDIYYMTLRLVQSNGDHITHIAGNYNLNTIEREFRVVRSIP